MLDEVDEDAQNAALEVPPAALSDRRLLRPALPSISLSPAVVACAHGRGPMCCSDALAVAGLPYTRPRDVAARMGGRPGAGVKWWLLVASQSVL